MAYMLIGEKNGVVFFAINAIIGSEGDSRASQVTSNPIERGSDLNDHHVNQPWKVSLSGTTVGGMAAFQKLEKMQDTHDVLIYAGGFRRGDLLITDVKRDRKNDNVDGCGFTCSLIQATFATSEYVKAGEVPMMSAQDAGKAKSVPASQTAKIKNDGKQTTARDVISDQSYTNYVSSFNAKPAGNGVGSGANPSVSGVR